MSLLLHSSNHSPTDDIATIRNSELTAVKRRDTHSASVMFQSYLNRKQDNFRHCVTILYRTEDGLYFRNVQTVAALSIVFIISIHTG